MPRYLVMVQWGAGHRYPMGPEFTAKDDKQALANRSLEQVKLNRKRREGRTGAKPHGTLLRVVVDERPKYKDSGRVEGTGPETPYLDLREEN